MVVLNTKRVIIAAMIVALLFCHSFAQEDKKVVVGIADFTIEENNKEQYLKSVTEKVVQIFTNAKRFTVVDRSSLDKIDDELRYQRSDASFMDQLDFEVKDAAVAAEKMVIGHVLKLPIQRVNNPDGSLSGYRANVALTLKVTDVETRKTTDAETFNGTQSPLMANVQSALTAALNTLDNQLTDWLKREFPLTTKIAKINTVKKNKAKTVLISGGKSFGLNPGDKLSVDSVEELNGQVLQETIGTLQVIKNVGDFSECKVKSGGDKILSQFNANANLVCKLLLGGKKK